MGSPHQFCYLAITYGHTHSPTHCPQPKKTQSEENKDLAFNFVNLGFTFQEDATMKTGMNRTRPTDLSTVATPIALQNLGSSNSSAKHFQSGLQEVLRNDINQLEDRDIVHVLADVIEERPDLPCDDVKNLSQKIESVGRDRLGQYDVQVLKEAFEYFYNVALTKPR